MRVLASTPLPTGDIFQAVFEDEKAFEDGVISEENLAKWDAPPPYHLDTGDKEIHRIEQALDGRHLRQQQLYEVGRIKRFHEASMREKLLEVCTELTKYLEEFERSADFLQMPESPEKRLAVNLLQWHARCSVALEQDYLALQRGNKALMDLYVLRWARL
jgi:hypothetical protein